MVERIRIVVAELGSGGSDGPARGATAIARALRDSGAEVVFTGADQTPAQVVQTVLQEDAGALLVVGGADGTLLHATVELLAEHEADDVAVFGVGAASDPSVAEPDRVSHVTMFPARATVDDIVARVHTDAAVPVNPVSDVPGRR